MGHEQDDSIRQLLKEHLLKFSLPTPSWGIGSRISCASCCELCEIWPILEAKMLTRNFLGVVVGGMAQNKLTESGLREGRKAFCSFKKNVEHLVQTPP